VKFDHRHYVPILKAKAGEFWALSHLKEPTKSLLTPVLELAPHDKKKTNFEADLMKKVTALGESWKSQFFFDVQHIAPKNGLPEAGTISAAFKRIRGLGMSGIPVTKLGYSPKFQDAIRAIVSQDNVGLMVRLGVGDLAIREKLTTALTNLCTFLGVPENEVDLMIDYGFKHPDEYEDLIVLQELHFSKIPKLKSWRTLTLASASFPESINDLPHAEWVPLERTEWKSWERLTFAGKTARKPSYGDYAIRHPKPPGFGTPKPNLRYTLENSYLCRRDEAKHAAMKDICRSLIKRSEYTGAPFSAGDAAISATAANQGSGGTGGGQQWTQWCSNHHVEFVATQIQNLPSS
jgi:hypothetical protein